MTSIVQPSKEDIIGANLYLVGAPVRLDLDLKLMVDNGTVMYYRSSVTAYNSDAQWDGMAKVCFGGLYFAQDCHTVCTSDSSRKQWRDTWARSDNYSPANLIYEWLEVAEHQGALMTRPVAPADQSDYLANFGDPAYRITWTESTPNWKALCDAHPDTLFGGEGLLGGFSKVKVTMFFGTDDLLLDVILLTVDGEDGRWLNFSIVPYALEVGPNTSYDGEIEQGIILSEEWEMVSSADSAE